MIVAHNPYLLSCSAVLAILASYSILNVAARVQKIEGSSLVRRCWLLGGALVIGSGVWSTYFVGMLACKVSIAINYDPSRTAFSWLMSVVIAYLALRVTTEGELSGWKVALGGSLLGAATVTMHYVGTVALQIRPALHYRAGLIVASIAIAITASWAALWITFLSGSLLAESEAMKQRWAALVMGLGIAAMHYAGTLATVFPLSAFRPAAQGLGVSLLTPLVLVGAAISVAVTIALTMFDSRIDELLLSANGSLDIAAERINAMNGLDPVTGIGSRASFLQELEQKMSKARREGTLLGLVFVDLDGFKSVNDSLGYTAGDALLRSFSDDLRRRVRVDTALGRLGGDEFALVLDGFDDPEKVIPMARSILERIRTEFEVEGVLLRVTASAGISIFPRDGTSVDALLKNANVAMHAAKDCGKNSFRVFDSLMSDVADRKVQITRGLSEALAQSQFSLVFQPKFNGRQQRITGAEALIRWCHPQLGNIPPMDFIPLAEETGQIVPISEWVIREVCRQIVTWQNMGLNSIKVAINLSPEQLRLEGYAERIYAMVRAAGVHPDRIMFEITETAAMREPKLAMAAITEFQQAGFDFAIDDFGTGYSSMAYLQQFRVKELKIDRFFVNSLEDGAEEGHTIVSAIIALAHALHMTVVAEGVETATQLGKLNSMDCDEVQGYLLGRPLVPADFEKLLRGDEQKDEFAEVGTARPAGQVAPKPRLQSALA